MVINLNPMVINELQKIPIKECGIFDNYNEYEINNQMQFLADMLLMSKPKRILEIGTNHCYFPYFAGCVCPGIIIDTVDIDKNAQMGVDVLKRLGFKINFYNKPSSEFFKSFSARVDFCWVDGSHKYEDCLQDMLSCAKLKVPVICVDDFRYNNGVLKAVFEFYRRSKNYMVYSQSYIMDHRGIICFKIKSL